MLNYLVSFKTFVDNLEAYSKHIKGGSEFKSKVLSMIYEKEPVYAFFYHFRNFVAHLGVVFDKVSIEPTAVSLECSKERCFDRLLKYQCRFLEIYNYPKQQDSMSALHAKVISIDQCETLITSANLSYHGQEGNIELGTHIISKETAIQVEQLFTQLVFSKVFEKYIQ